MEKSQEIHGEASRVIKTYALEASLKLAVQIIQDIAYHNRHKDAEYLHLVTEFLSTTTPFLEDDDDF